MLPLDEQYPELFEGPPDLKLEQLVTDLDLILQPIRLAKLPQKHDEAIMYILREKALVTTKKQMGFPQRPPALFAPRRLLLAVVIVFSILIITGTAFAAMPLLSQALKWQDERSQVVIHHQLGQNVYLAQNACGFVMTIQRVYADANDIVLGYTIQAPLSRTFMGGFTPFAPILTDAQGTRYQAIEGNGTGTVNNQTGNVLLFDAGGTTNHPALLHLHLFIPGIVTSERVNGKSRSFVPCESYVSFRKDEVPQGIDATQLRKVTAHGSLAFNMAIPFSSGKEIDVHQKNTSKGTMVTLNRIVITTLETRFYVSGVTQATEAHLSIHNQMIIASQSWPSASGDEIYSFTSMPLSNQNGTWAFVVYARPDLAKVTVGGAPVGGPWAFIVNVP